ncbi:response regulator [Methanoregula sp.]|uniref:response regulator n=1 Tax=Methanoregula sp. TaxID=2052170 RepID=UPI003C716837
MAPLEQKGYRITLFDDPPTLIESLHEGKPNLLICDTLSFPEAYDLCRHIKDDADLWVIPVLILTAASDLSDLLHILDCNADNYIAYPYDPEYFLSLVDGILSTPVERQTPEQIKTQFKIQHDDRIFVVTADRRKLLEFLLSSFEIAVSKFHDLSRATDEIHVLSDDVNRLGMFVDGQKQTVEELNSSLREKDRAIRTLEQTRSEQEQALLDKTGEIDRLARDLEADKALLGAAEDQLRALIRNKDESERQSVAEISDLRQQVTSLAAELGTATATLQESRNAHSIEQSGRAEALASLAEITQGKELAEKSVRALKLDNEQMKVSLAAEKNRAVAAEQETRSVLLAKSGSEQDLTAIINDLRETAKQQALDLHRQKAEIDDAKNQVLNLEIQLGNLKTDTENAESVLRATTGHLQQDLAITREKLDAAQATLDEKDLDIERLNVSYNEILGERDKTGSELQSLTRELRTAQEARDNKDLEIERLNVSYNGILGERDKAGSELQALSGELRNVQQALDAEKEHHHATEESLNAVIRERDAALQSLQGSHQSAQADLAEHRDNLAQVRLDLASASAGRSSLERDLESVSARMRELEARMQREVDSRELADQQVRSLSDELETVNAALENERRLHNSTVESLRSSALETERYGQDLGKLSEQLASARSSLASEEELRSAAESETEDLRRKLVAAEDRSRSQDASMAATIETLKAELSSASHWQQDLEHRVQGLTREKQLAEEKAGSLADEIEQARVALADEWVDHMNDHDQLTVAAHEKQLAEEKAGSLAAEIEQARVALADEWVDHMNARERLTAAALEKQQLEKSLSRAEEPEAEKARKRAIIIKGPDLPMEIRAASHALTTPGTLHVPPPDTKRITGVEDLFEDDDVTKEPGTTPTVSIIQEPSGDPDWVPPMPDLSQFPGEIQSPPYGEGLPGNRRVVDPEVEGTHDVSEEEGSEDEDSDGEVAGDGYPDDGTNGADEDAPGDSPASGPAGESAESITPALSFNRAQWFDLLKWAHHSGALTPEQRMQIVRMGRLIQKGRKLTRKQDEQVREMIVLVQTLGYRFT